MFLNWAIEIYVHGRINIVLFVLGTDHSIFEGVVQGICFASFFPRFVRYFFQEFLQFLNTPQISNGQSLYVLPCHHKMTYVLVWNGFSINRSFLKTIYIFEKLFSNVSRRTISKLSNHIQY